MHGCQIAESVSLMTSRSGVKPNERIVKCGLMTFKRDGSEVSTSVVKWSEV